VFDLPVQRTDLGVGLGERGFQGFVHVAAVRGLGSGSFADHREESDAGHDAQAHEAEEAEKPDKGTGALLPPQIVPGGHVHQDLHSLHADAAQGVHDFVGAHACEGQIQLDREPGGHKACQYSHGCETELKISHD
jgi:hypothetical protein